MLEPAKEHESFCSNLFFLCQGNIISLADICKFIYKSKLSLLPYCSKDATCRLSELTNYLILYHHHKLPAEKAWGIG